MAAFTSTASAISQTAPAAKKKRKRCSKKKRRVRKSPKPAKPPRSLAKKRWKRRNPKRKSRKKNPSRRKPPPLPEVRGETSHFAAPFPLSPLLPNSPLLPASYWCARQVTHVRHHPRENLYPLWSHDGRWHHRDSERQNRQCRSRRRSPRRRPGDRRQGPAGLSRPVRSHHANGFARDRRGQRHSRFRGNWSVQS